MPQIGEIIGFRAWWEPTGEIRREWIRYGTYGKEETPLAQKRERTRWPQRPARSIAPSQPHPGIEWVAAWMEDKQLQEVFGNPQSLKIFAAKNGYTVKDLEEMKKRRKEKENW